MNVVNCMLGPSTLEMDMGRPYVGMMRLQQLREDMQALEDDPEALGPSGLTQALDPYMNNPRAAFQVRSCFGHVQ